MNDDNNWVAGINKHGKGKMNDNLYGHTGAATVKIYHFIGHRRFLLQYLKALHFPP